VRWLGQNRSRRPTHYEASEAISPELLMAINRNLDQTVFCSAIYEGVAFIQRWAAALLQLDPFLVEHNGRHFS
jgi:hypothetical protein